jgi:hypothetical protein
MRFKLRFPVSAIERWAEAFSDASDSVIERSIAPAAREQGYLTRGQFLRIAEWKTPRSRPRCERNDAEFVKEVTRAALGSKNEQFKIQALRLLEGVEWPTASVILHFCDRGRYPILDVRALWSAGLDATPSYSSPMWMEYTDFMRGLATGAGVSMRTLDKALWQYSKVKQVSVPPVPHRRG